MRFNLFKRKEHIITNHEGARAYKLSPEAELYTAVVTTALADSFYEQGNARLVRIQELIPQVAPAYAAKLAVYTRTVMHMRSVPMVLAVELAKLHSGNGIVSKAVAGVVRRADEITELLAYYQMANGRTGTKKLNRLSKQVQKGLSVSFNRFDEYQFSKYDRSGEVTLRDALFLVHPKAKNSEQQMVFNKIAAKLLAVPYTWETELSALGQAKYTNAEEQAAAKATKWEELIDSGRMGYMATLRNLRNILQANVSAKHILQVCGLLADKQAVTASKQLPFRFLAAYREIKVMTSAYTAMVLDALEFAISASAANLQGFDASARILIACDVSGSMQRPVSAQSSIQLYDIGLALGMLMQSKCKTVVSGMFGTSWKIINMPSRGILANVQKYYSRHGEVGLGTNGHLVIDDLIARRVKMDKVMLFTDCQLWDDQHGGESLRRSWAVYKRMFPGAKLYLFDLAGYGQSPLSLAQADVYLIAGWSDKVFDVLQAIEDGSSAIERINAVAL